jgi:hypothetical protein
LHRAHRLSAACTKNVNVYNFKSLTKNSHSSLYSSNDDRNRSLQRSRSASFLCVPLALSSLVSHDVSRKHARACLNKNLNTFVRMELKFEKFHDDQFNSFLFDFRRKKNRNKQEEHAIEHVPG